jgi:hypothetical protein
MTQSEYNAKLQELQAMWGDDCRIHRQWKGEELTAALFQVYWDGHWRTLGRQKLPFTDATTYEWEDVLELELRGSFAGALARS